MLTRALVASSIPGLVTSPWANAHHRGWKRPWGRRRIGRARSGTPPKPAGHLPEKGEALRLRLRRYAVTTCRFYLLIALLGCASSSTSNGANGVAGPPAAAATAPPAAPVRPDPDGLPAEVARHGELALALAQKLGPRVPCSTVARELDAFVKAHRHELAKAHSALVSWEQGATPALLKAFYTRYFPAIEVRIDAGMRCHDNAAARAAFDRFFAASGLDQPSR